MAALAPSTSPAHTPRKSEASPAPSSCSFDGGPGVFNLIARLIAWYALYTVLFLCPAYPTSDSPAICHPAHTAKVALRPHVLPHYEAYAAPYVQRINRQYIVPAHDAAYALYLLYGEPYVSKSSNFAAAGYSRYLKQHVATVRSKAGNYYVTYVSPHAETANKIWIDEGKPAVEVVREKAGIFWRDYMLPYYNRVQPYLSKAYEQAQYVVMVIIAPVVKEGGEKVMKWGRGIWCQGVRPQVGRIGERLGMTSGNGYAGSTSSALSSTVASSHADARPPGDDAIESMISSASASKASDSAAGVEPTSKLTKEQAKAMIAKDLKSWSTKFSASSIKTLADLRSQIDQISERAYQRKSQAVEDEIKSLEKLIENGFADLKAQILLLAKGLSPDSSPSERNAAEEALVAVARRLGIQIRDKAQFLRKDAERFLAKVYDDVSEAADQHLEVLDGINDMGMHELGMKWAWMDYVSYKDWAKYHDLKKDMKESRTIIIKSAQSNDKLLEITKWVEDDWEGKATDIAKHAAEELNRIKKIGKKKIELADVSDDFSDDFFPVVVKKADQQVLKTSSGAAKGEKKETVAVQISDVVEEGKSIVEEAVAEASTSTIDSESTVPAAPRAPESIVFTDSTKSSATEAVSTAISEAVDSAAPTADSAPPTESEAVDLSSSIAPEVIESDSSTALEAVDSASSTESEAVDLSSPIASEAIESDSSTAPEAVESVPPIELEAADSSSTALEDVGYASSTVLEAIDSSSIVSEAVRSDSSTAPESMPSMPPAIDALVWNAIARVEAARDMETARELVEEAVGKAKTMLRGEVKGSEEETRYRESVVESVRRRVEAAVRGRGQEL